jgi:hypothetical protein
VAVVFIELSADAFLDAEQLAITTHIIAIVVITSVFFILLFRKVKITFVSLYSIFTGSLVFLADET